VVNYWFSKNYLTGGNVYNHMAFDALRERGFQPVSRNAFTSYRGKGHSYLNACYTYLALSSRTTDLDILDYGVATCCSPRIRGKRILILFHFDPAETRKKRIYQFYFDRFRRNAQDAKVVVIARHWKEFLERQGFQDLEIIHPAYDVDRYQPYHSREAFLKEHALPDRPIVYLGKNSKPKTQNIYQQLRPLADRCLLITSGPKREFEGPLNLDLNFKAYCSLLHHSAVTVTMPQFDEGWSRIAHESVICGTPVIGNGRGGMAELLQDTRQMILPDSDPGRIIHEIGEIVSTGRRVPEEDREFARTFNLKYFADRWEEVVRKMVDR